MAVGVGAESKRMKIERQWSSSWSRLPEDIIFSIMNRLGYVGQLRFRAVCKSWRQANIRGIKSADTLPWKMAVDPRSCCFMTLLKIKNTLLIQRFLLRNMVGSFLRNEKMMKKSIPTWLMQHSSCIHLSLIGLFTYRILYWSWMTKQHFLCLQILQIVRLDRDKKLLIRMCRPGETTWIKLAIFKFFDTEDSSEKYGPAHNVEYVDGVLYISFEQIAVVAYNPKLDDSKLYPYPCNEGKNIVYEYLFESDGNLLLYHDELDDLVFRLDRPQMKWIRIHNLDNRSLFLGTNSWLFIPMEETSELVNTRHAVVCHCSMCTKISGSFHLDVRHMEDYCWIQVPQMIWCLICFLVSGFHKLDDVLFVFYFLRFRWGLLHMSYIYGTEILWRFYWKAMRQRQKGSAEVWT